MFFGSRICLQLSVEHGTEVHASLDRYFVLIKVEQNVRTLCVSDAADIDGTGNNCHAYQAVA